MRPSKPISFYEVIVKLGRPKSCRTPAYGKWRYAMILTGRWKVGERTLCTYDRNVAKKQAAVNKLAYLREYYKDVLKERRKQQK